MDVMRNDNEVITRLCNMSSDELKSILDSMDAAKEIIEAAYNAALKQENQ